jgi:hypothetical protein
VRQRGLTCKSAKRAWKITATGRLVAIYIFALFLLSSAFVTACHFHPDLKTRPDCAICKSASDLAGGDKHELLPLIPQEILLAISVIPKTESVSAIFVRSESNRAPPV